MRILGALLICAGCAGRAPVMSDTRDENEPAPRTVVSLRLSDLSGDSPPPRSSLELVLVHDHAEREILPVGEITGICTPEAEPRGVLAAVQCWWQGQDTIYSARRVGDVLQVRRTDETLLEVAVPSDVETHALNE